MKVLATIVVPPHLSVSGATRAAERLSAELARYCDIDIASMQRSSMQETMPVMAGMDVSRVPVRVSNPLGLTEGILPNRFRTLFYLSDMPRLIRHSDYDLVHIHNPMPAVEMMRVAQACVSSGIPYVVSTHGFIEVSQGVALHRLGPLQRLAWSMLVSCPLRAVMRNASAVAALSPVDIPAVRSFGFAGDDIALVPNGVDLPSDDMTGDGPALARFNIVPRAADSPICAFFLANHTPNKGLGVLLEAFSTLRRPYLLVVGGERRDYVDYDRYERMGDADHRILFTGRLSEAEVAALHRRSDLFVFPTLADTFPLTVLEAMAHGRPVVASRVGGIPYQIDAECGRLVEPGDVESLIAAIETLAGDRDRLWAMGLAARRRASESFNWRSSAATAADLYRRLLSRPVGAATPAPARS
ncbi:glycosyltransferase (plasmid) [Skermanella rosea]|uniref:glycosyltransferase n=1 Tax=Skermanella rosea TaxID=1817965 RepID=UPI0019325FA7|nr:glycosyltransferase [Skermanella rosea]UEM07348.1 glycosyltransferase [Skermanella rosea]